MRHAVSRYVLLGTILLVTGAIAWFSASNLHSHALQIERLLIRVTNPRSPPESAGFSGQGRLGSIATQKGLAGESVALRVWAGQSPGYLRGRVFATYAHSEWQRSGERIPVSPEKRELLPTRIAAGTDHVQTFLLSRTGSDTWQQMEIWPNRPFREVVFAPLGSAAWQAPVEQLTIDQHGVFETDELPVGTPYTVWSSAPVKTSDDALQRLARLPDDLDPRVRELASRVAGSCRTDGAKIAAIER